jgi:F-type H+-transporting ATPase subunit b
MELQPNFSLLLQVVLFVYLWFVLKRLLFEPVLHVLDTRTERTVGTVARARELTSEVEESRKRYDSTVQSVRQELVRETMDARAKAREQHAHLISTVQEESAAEMERFRAKLSGEISQARAVLEKDAHDLAELMIAKVVRRETR